MSDTDTDTEHNSAETGLSAMIDISWNTNWSELPPEAERHAEEAFEHLTKARDIAQEADDAE